MSSCSSPPPPPPSSAQAAPTRMAAASRASSLRLLMAPPFFSRSTLRPTNAPPDRPPFSRLPSLPFAGPTFQLVDVHRKDQHRAHRHLLPERLDPQDDEAVPQDGRDEDTH